MECYAAADMVCVMGKKAARQSLQSTIKQRPIKDSLIFEETCTSLQSKDTDSYLDDSNMKDETFTEKFGVKQGKVFINLNTGCCSFTPNNSFKVKEKNDNNSDCSVSILNLSSRKRPFDSSIQQGHFKFPKLDLSKKLPFVFNSDIKSKTNSDNFASFCSSYKVSKELLNQMKVIGQVSDKFIVCLMSKLIIIFDQHAVDERIRLERFVIESYEAGSDKKRLCTKKIIKSLRVSLPPEQIHSVINQKKTFDALGLGFETTSDETADFLLITQVPRIIYHHPHLPSLVHDMIQYQIKSTQHLPTIPPVLFNVLCSKACHGAIRFGDSLTQLQCVELIKNLALCQLPFQCAHGRPSLFPLLNLSEVITNEEASKCNFLRLKRAMT